MPSIVTIGGPPVSVPRDGTLPITDSIVVTRDTDSAVIAQLPLSGAAIVVGMPYVLTTIFGTGVYTIVFDSNTDATIQLGNGDPYTDFGLHWRCRDTHGIGPFSGPFVVPSIAPTAPTFGTITSTQVPVIVPAPVNGNNVYNIQRAPSVSGSSGTYATIKTLATSPGTFNDTGITAGSSYFYRFVTGGNYGTRNSPDSAVVNVPISVPAASMSASPASILVPGSSTLTWTTANSTIRSIDQGIGSVAASGSIVVSPTVTKTYTLTATGPGGSATSSATVTVAPLREIHVFSSGTLFANVGGTPIEFALLQNITVAFKSAKKLLYDCTIVSRFPIDTAFADGSATIQAESGAISPGAVVDMMGGSLSGITSLQVVTLSKAISKTPFTLALTHQDTTGVQHVWTFNNVYCPDLKLPVTVEDFLKPNFNMFALPDGSGVMAAVALGT